MTDKKAQINECLKRVNDFRAIHDVPPLTLNRQLTAEAQKWAETLADKETPIKLYILNFTVTQLPGSKCQIWLRLNPCHQFLCHQCANMSVSQSCDICFNHLCSFKSLVFVEF